MASELGKLCRGIPHGILHEIDLQQHDYCFGLDSGRIVDELDGRLCVCKAEIQKIRTVVCADLWNDADPFTGALDPDVRHLQQAAYG